MAFAITTGSSCGGVFAIMWKGLRHHVEGVCDIIGRRSMSSLDGVYAITWKASVEGVYAIICRGSIPSCGGGLDSIRIIKLGLEGA